VAIALPAPVGRGRRKKRRQERAADKAADSCINFPGLWRGRLKKGPSHWQLCREASPNFGETGRGGRTRHEQVCSWPDPDEPVIARLARLLRKGAKRRD
jgi:hypothetical protein